MGSLGSDKQTQSGFSLKTTSRHFSLKLRNNPSESYSMYLLHPMLMQVAYAGQFVVPVHYSDLKPIILYFGFLMITMITSICFYVGIEAPLMSLEKMVMG